MTTDGSEDTRSVTISLTGPFLSFSNSNSKSLDPTTNANSYPNDFRHIPEKLLKGGFVLEYSNSDDEETLPDTTFINNEKPDNKRVIGGESKAENTNARAETEDKDQNHQTFVLLSNDDIWDEEDASIECTDDGGKENEDEDGGDDSAMNNNAKSVAKYDSMESSEDIDTIPVTPPYEISARKSPKPDSQPFQLKISLSLSQDPSFSKQDKTNNDNDSQSLELQNSVDTPTKKREKGSFSSPPSFSSVNSQDNGGFAKRGDDDSSSDISEADKFPNVLTLATPKFTYKSSSRKLPSENVRIKVTSDPSVQSVLRRRRDQSDTEKDKKVKFSEAVDVCNLSQTCNTAPVRDDSTVKPDDTPTKTDTLPKLPKTNLPLLHSGSEFSSLTTNNSGNKSFKKNPIPGDKLDSNKPTETRDKPYNHNNSDVHEGKSQPETSKPNSTTDRPYKPDTLSSSSLLDKPDKITDEVAPKKLDSNAPIRLNTRHWQGSFKSTDFDEPRKRDKPDEISIPSAPSSPEPRSNNTPTKLYKRIKHKGTSTKIRRQLDQDHAAEIKKPKKIIVSDSSSDESDDSSPKKHRRASASRSPKKPKQKGTNPSPSPQKRKRAVEPSIEPKRLKETKRTLHESPSSSPARPISRSNSFSHSDTEEYGDLYKNYTTIPTPETPSRKGPLFQGFFFIVTGIRSDRMGANTVRELIESNGGKVISNIFGSPISPIKRIYKKGVPKTILLSDRDRLTIKYILGIASGTPCLHYNWLSHCLDKSAILPYEPYLLPTGYSTFKNSIIHREEIPYQNYVFDGCRIELFGPTDWREEWSRVLKESGAKIVGRLFSAQADRLDYIVSDKLPEPEIQDRAKEANIPIASTKWVIECILMQEVLPLDSVPEFQY